MNIEGTDLVGAYKNFSIGEIVRTPTTSKEISTLNKRQKKIVNDGVKDLTLRQKAEKVCLQSTREPLTTITKLIIICTTMLAGFMPASAEVVDVGRGVNYGIDDGMLNNILNHIFQQHLQ